MKLETTILAHDIARLRASRPNASKRSATTSSSRRRPGHDPFLPLMIVAEHTQQMRFGTAVAIAFPRSPMVTAQIAWDLQRFSGGRFILGLGTQVKGHNERRYSTAWPSPPGPRLRDYILTLKAIFETFQTNARPVVPGPALPVHADLAVLQPRPEHRRPRADLHLGRQPVQLPARRRGLRRHPHARLQHDRSTRTK